MLDFLKQKKNIFIVIGIIVLFGGYYILNFNDWGVNGDVIVSNNENNFNDFNDKDVNNDVEEIAVYIVGEIKNPGVIKIQEGARIEDVVNAAGGLTENADITGVNLAYVVEDGIKIKIPSIGESMDVQSDNYIENEAGNGVIISDDTKNENSNIVNINTATQTELESLNGIGPSLALKILDYREKNGKFKKKEDIKNVSGIGENKYNGIKDFIKIK